MMCFKHLLPYALLLPMSSASPVFIYLFALMLFFSIRPCGYCLALISVLFLSTSPSSPFISLTHTPELETGSMIEPMRKTWFDLNNGYLFDPVIRAFSTNTTTTSHLPASPSASSSIKTKSELPENYVDMRYRGLGFVFDFGWRRTEEGMEWEMRDWESTKRRYGLLEDVEVGRGWLSGILGRLRVWVNELMGMMWPREGSLVDTW